MRVVKKIAFVMDEISAGGVEHALLQLLDHFDYQRYHVVLYLKKTGGAFQGRVNANVEIRTWAATMPREEMMRQMKRFDIPGLCRSIYFRLLMRIHSREWNLNTFYSGRCFPKQKEQFDCVIAYKGICPDVIAMARYCLSAKKYVLWFHGRNIRPERLNSFFDQIYRKFDRIYYVSEASRQENLRDFPRSADKTRVMYNLLDADGILEKSRQPLPVAFAPQSLCTVGRIVEVKGQHLIPKTVRMLLDAGYPVTWYLIGDGEGREQVEALIQTYHVEEHVILLGTQLNPYPYMKACDIYVQPSISEGYGLSVAEARILCKPMVVTNLPVMHEQLEHGVTGWIAEAVTSEALFEGIRHLLGDASLCRELAENLRAETHDSDEEIKKLFDFMDDKE